MRVEFFKHSLGAEELEELRATLATRFLTYGPKTRELEAAMGRYLGVPHAVGLSSCTAALILAQRALGLEAGDEVVTTPLTFVATSNSTLLAGATPVFADVDPRTGNLDLAAAEAAIGPRTKAIVLVHLWGHMADVRAFRDLADRHGIALIEDAAHCVEGSYAGIRPGQRSHCAVFSFYATKNLTSGEGGMLVSGDADLVERVRRQANHGLTRAAVDRYHGRFVPWDIEELGTKANMFDVQAALLTPQLRNVGRIVEQRRAAFERYRALLAGVAEDDLALPAIPDECASAHHLFVVLCRDGTRDDLMNHLIERDVGVGIHYSPVHLTTYYRTAFGHRPGQFPAAEDLGSRCLSLPFFAGITEEEQRYVAETIEGFYGARR